MENILLVILLLVALAMIGLVLVQRNEGGGLGIGGGGGGGMGGRPKANPLARLTWILGAAFFGLSITLTILNNEGGSGSSVTDLISTDGEGDGLLPPPTNDEALLPPSNSDAGAATEGDGDLLPPKEE